MWRLSLHWNIEVLYFPRDTHLITENTFDNNLNTCSYDWNMKQRKTWLFHWVPPRELKSAQKTAWYHFQLKTSLKKHKDDINTHYQEITSFDISAVQVQRCLNVYFLFCFVFVLLFFSVVKSLNWSTRYIKFINLNYFYDTKYIVWICRQVNWALWFFSLFVIV